MVDTMNAFAPPPRIKNIVYHADNALILPQLPDDFFQLIYIDPLLIRERCNRVSQLGLKGLIAVQELDLKAKVTKPSKEK